MILLSFYCINEENYIQPPFDDERRFLKLLLDASGLVERVGMPSFQPSIPDSQGQVSSNQLNYRLWFISEGGYSKYIRLISLDKTF